MKEQILKLREEGKTYNEIKEILGCSKSTISYYCGDKQKEKTNIRNKLYKSLKKENKVLPKKEKKNKNDKIKKEKYRFKNCLICNNLYKPYSKRQQCCSLSCKSIFQNKIRYDTFIKNWKENKISGGKGDKQGHGCVSNYVRKYLFEKYNNKCSNCGWSERNIFTNTIPLEVEHIDGNCMNHKEDNLTLLCPNCHSLTSGHSTSKGNGRRYYRQKYHLEKVGCDGVEPPDSEENAFTVHPATPTV